MAKLSRRRLVAGVVTAPLALGGSQRESALTRQQAVRLAPKPDPVIAKVAAWMVERDAVDAMTLDWQDLESALCAKVRTMGLSLTRACRSSLPEARAMRALDRKIKASLRRLERAAGAIVLLRATSAEGALAKIKMGLRIQGPYDWEDYAFALAQDGCEHLALLLARASTGTS